MTQPPDPRPADPRPFAPRPVPAQQEPESGIGRMIPAKNGPALLGYYLGVFSLVPAIGFALGLAAVPLGVAGLRRIAREPGLPGRVHAWVAIVLGGISVLGHAAVLVLILTSRR